MRAALLENAAAAVCATHADVTEVLAALRLARFHLGRISVVGPADCCGHGVVGCYGDQRAKYWGTQGKFWDDLWGTLSGWGFFSVPGIGLVLVAGPLSALIVAALENASIFCDLSALGAALYNIGIPRESMPTYEGAVEAGEYLVVVYGAAEEVARAKGVLRLAARQVPAPNAA